MLKSWHPEPKRCKMDVKRWVFFVTGKKKLFFVVTGQIGMKF